MSRPYGNHRQLPIHDIRGPCTAVRGVVAGKLEVKGTQQSPMSQPAEHLKFTLYTATPDAGAHDCPSSLLVSVPGWQSSLIVDR